VATIDTDGKEDTWPAKMDVDFPCVFFFCATIPGTKVMNI